jgi:glycyl-tRNA synthetase beta chain
MRHFDFLVEIGTEELPPKSLLKLSEAFTQGVLQRLGKAGLKFGEAKSYAAPRRLALLIENLDEVQGDQLSEKRGPALNAAFDAAGNPTKACEGFAKSCGTTTDKLVKLETDKGSWMIYKQVIQGEKAKTLIPAFVAESLAELPISKRMRWGAGRVEFVRPVHWVVMLANGDVIDAEILGKKADRYSQGHRFHNPGKLAIPYADEYESILQNEGKVIADFVKRRDSVKIQILKLAEKKDAVAIIDPDLLDEVTALNEWPVALLGRFEERFLKVPAEALISTMKENQKYFHLLDKNGTMLPNFITVANLESRDPAQVVEGNERVVRPRLADAAFFFETDKKQTLESRIAALQTVVFQKDLGTVFDRVTRISTLAGSIAEAIGYSTEMAKRAGLLCKADLATSMVSEFPDLQGIMGRYYALDSGEAPEVATAIEEHYRPRFSGDTLPDTETGVIVSLAEKLDTLVGIFGINQPPTGTKDPFALRRAALGVLRILVEKSINLDLKQLARWSIATYSIDLPAVNLTDKVTDYLIERFRSWYDDAGVAPEVFLSVAARKPTNPLDFSLRVKGVGEFITLAEASSLIMANKRVSNILEKESAATGNLTINSLLLTLSEEIALHKEIERLEEAVKPMLKQFDYEGALKKLAELKGPIDSFFDKVMVMSEDQEVKMNRICLLQSLRQLFLQIADISLLQGIVKK